MTKLTNLSEAIRQFVHDGDCVYAAGFTHLIPFAAGHEIIRQGRKNLVLARATPDLIYDQMTAAGCARKLIFSYLGNPGVMKHLAHNPARVIVKFVEVHQAEQLNDIESKVAYRSNNQNKVSPSDLMIELPSLVSLQRYFRRHGVHLERKKGEHKLYIGETGISKERLAQVLSAVESSEGAVKAKRKQELFLGPAPRLFSDFDASEKSRAEAIAWARIDDVFRATINQFANKKRKKRAQQAQLASLRVFHRVLQSTQLKCSFLRAMARWDTDNFALEQFLEKSFKAIITVLLQCSSQHKKNEPAFYKALESVKPAVRSATWHSKRKVRQCYRQYLSI